MTGQRETGEEVERAATYMVALSPEMSREEAIQKAQGNFDAPLPPHLDWDGFLFHYRNEFGTPITFIRCQECQQAFSLCPALTPRDAPWPTCMAPECPSYDIERDVMAIIGFGWGTLHADCEGETDPLGEEGQS